MSRPLRVLVIEEAASDMGPLLQALERDYRIITSESVDAPEALRAALARGSWDVVLSDYDAAGFEVAAALTITRALDPDLPFVVISHAVSEELASELFRIGVSDYVLKRSPARLVSVVHRELQAMANRRAQRAGGIAVRRLAAIV